MTTTATAHSVPSRTRGRAARVALVVLQVLLAALYVASGLGKVTLEPATAAGFAAMGVAPASTQILGILELLGAIGLLVPRIAGLAAAALTALMIGAVIVTATTVGGTMTLVPAVVLVLVAVVAGARRHETAALVRRPRHVLLGR